MKNYLEFEKEIKSLEEKPQKSWLRKIYECEDEKALKYFLRDKNLETKTI